MGGPIPPRSGAHHAAAPIDMTGTAVIPVATGESHLSTTGDLSPNVTPGFTMPAGTLPMPPVLTDAQPPVTAKRIIQATIEDVLEMLEAIKSGYAARGFDFEYDLQFNVKKVQIQLKR